MSQPHIRLASPYRRAARTEFRSAVRRTALGLAFLAALAGCPSVAVAQDPVAELKQELLFRPYVDPFLPPEKRQAELKKAYDERELKLGKLIDGRLSSFPALRQALLLKEWGDMAKTPRDDLEGLASDARLRARIAQRFRTMVRAVVDHGDDDSKAAVANLITEMGLTVRAAADPEKLVKLEQLSRTEKPTPDETIERDRLLSELDNERRAGFARSLTDEIIRLTKADSEFVRLHALRALAGSNPDPKRAAAEFGAMLASSTDVATRRIAADGLIRLIGIANYLKELELKSLPVWASKTDVLVTDAEVVKHAPTGLTDADAVVRARCAEALRVCAQVLAVQFQRPPDDKKDLPSLEYTRAQIDAIKDILKGFQNAGPRLAVALEDSDVEVRLAVVQALERLSDTRYRLAESPVNAALGKGGLSLTPPQASDPLLNFAKGDWRTVAKVLNDPEVRVRRSAVNFLEFFPEARPAAVPDLTKALADSDRFVRWGATRALGNFSKGYQPADAAPAVAALARVLFDDDHTVRLAATVTLEALGAYAEPAVPELARAVHFGDPENRVAVLYVLQSVGPERAKSAIGSVTEALAYQDARVRRAAAETLGKYGDVAHNKTTIDALRQALGDEDQEVRINASEALLQILGAGVPAKGKL